MNPWRDVNEPRISAVVTILVADSSDKAQYIKWL